MIAGADAARHDAGHWRTVIPDHSFDVYRHIVNRKKRKATIRHVGKGCDARSGRPRGLCNENRIFSG
jgi:hypothetical protein